MHLLFRFDRFVVRSLATISLSLSRLNSCYGGPIVCRSMAGIATTPLRFPAVTPRISATLSRRRIATTPRFFSHPSATTTPPPLKMSTRRLPLGCSAARPDTATEEKPVSDERMLVFVPPHPLIKHWISVLRNEQTPCAIFKSAMAELGRLLIYEASRDWLIVPILRAGLALAEHAPSVLPASVTYHLGMHRDETTLEPSVYLNNLPDKFPEGSRILIVDPMLATGGTIVAAIDLLKDRGVDNKQIKIISAVVAPPALQKLSKKFSGLHVYAGMIDSVVNEKGFIIPGLGDAGDRSFGT
ncbi:uracil phosphoribosyltransferase-like isoform X2 [Musa acuminata AAA Group]|uniref:uracil phosphoribosyltransferase-like isoform X2 n=1 Tax=Musa acuminata AAA Group TaxID=214697 RepID=UPI0031E2FF82